MSKLKAELKDSIYYTDTDSLYTTIQLDNKYIGNELGQLKLERIFKKCTFLAPKVYGGILVTIKILKILKRLNM